MIDRSIIKIASEIKNYGLRNNFTHAASSKNKICGDKITIELIVENKIIKDIRYELEACIFCQASISLLTKIIRNLSIEEWKVEIKKLQRKKSFQNIFLSKKLELLSKIFLKKYNIRYNCIILPFNTLLKAINE